MADLKYNFLDNDYFTVFEPVEVETPTINMPLFDTPQYTPSYVTRISDDGTPVVGNNLESKMTINNTEEYVPAPSTTIETPITTQGNGKRKNDHTWSNGATLSRIIDEVSNESGFNELKDPKVKRLIMLQAARESNYTQKVPSLTSTAAGYFLFVDKTRRNFSNYSKKDFLNDPKELVRAAYKHLKYIHNLPDAKKLKQAGYNDDLITVLGWWLPSSLSMVLRGERNYSLGGYSIKQAFLDYG